MRFWFCASDSASVRLVGVRNNSAKKLASLTPFAFKKSDGRRTVPHSEDAELLVLLAYQTVRKQLHA